MSLADFWDNVTTPGFLSASFDELKDLCKEIKEEATELVEEGEELFTDGFKEIVLKNNSEYKTSIDKRNDGKEEVKAVQNQLLEARGVTDDNRSIVNVLDGQFRFLIETIEQFEKTDIESICGDLRREFPNITFKSPKEVFGFLGSVVRLLRVPEPPKHEVPPADEKIRRIGPVGLFTSDKEKRVVAVDEYLKKVSGYVKQIKLEIENQKKVELVFDSALIPEDAQKLIMDLGETYWDVSSGGIWNSLTTEDSVAERARKLKNLRNLLMLAGAIYSIGETAMTDIKGSASVSKEMLAELMAIKKQIKSHTDEGQDESDPKTRTEDGMESNQKNDAKSIINILTVELKHIAENIGMADDSEVDEIINELRGKFASLNFMTSSEIRVFQEMIAGFLNISAVENMLKEYGDDNTCGEVHELLQLLSDCFRKVSKVIAERATILKTLGGDLPSRLSGPKRSLTIWLMLAAGIVSISKYTIGQINGMNMFDWIAMKEELVLVETEAKEFVAGYNASS